MLTTRTAFVRYGQFSSQLTHLPKPVLPVSPGTHQSLSESGYSANLPSNLDIRGNQLAEEVLAGKAVQLTDARVKVRSVDVAGRRDMGLGGDFVQADLGEVKMYGKEQVLLQDVDPRNIPADKDIILTPTTAKLTAIGLRQPAAHDGRLHSHIFIETANTWSVRLTWRSYLKGALLAPVVYFGLLYLQTAREHYSVQKVYTALDEEDKQLLDEIKHIPRLIRNGRQAELDFYGD